MVGDSEFTFNAKKVLRRACLHFGSSGCYKYDIEIDSIMIGSQVVQRFRGDWVGEVIGGGSVSLVYQGYQE